MKIVSSRSVYPKFNEPIYRKATIAASITNGYEIARCPFDSVFKLDDDVVSFSVVFAAML
jgi:hypothetical protein